MNSTRPLSFSSTYGWTQLSPREMYETMEKSCRKIGKLHKELKFDAIAFTGSSGAALAFVAGITHRIPVIYVRKEGEKAHGRPVECNTTAPIHTYLIVDDFIASGNTLRSIRNAINIQATKNTEARPKCVGIFLYDSQATRSFAFDKRTRTKVYTP